MEQRASVIPTAWKPFSVCPYKTNDNSNERIFRNRPISAQFNAPNFDIVRNTNT